MGWALDAMDVGLISFIIAALARQWHLTPGESGLIASIGFAGMAIGASLGGLLADRFGRRQIFAITLLIFGLASGASALATGVGMLIVLRFFVGLGLGAELPVASTYVMEFAPARIRGRIIVFLEAFWAVGWTASAVVGTFVVPAGPNGWRWAFVIGALPVVYTLVVRWGLPESPRWLLSRGKHDAARRIVDSLDGGASSPATAGTGNASAGSAGPSNADVCNASTGTAADGGREAVGAKEQALAHSGNLSALHTGQEAAGSRPSPTSTITSTGGDDQIAHPTHTTGHRLAALLSPEFRGRTLALWMVWLCVNFAYYGAFIWIPSILVAAGFGMVKSFGFTLIMTLAQLPGYAAAGWLIEKWGRRSTLSVFLVGSAVSAMVFGTVHDEKSIVISGLMLSFFNLGAWGALYAVTPEVYPTVLRATGAGWAAGVGRLASIIAPLIVPTLLGWGVGVTFGVFAGFFVAAAIAVWGVEDRRGMALREE